MFLPTSVITVALSANQTLVTKTTMPPSITDASTPVGFDPKASNIALMMGSLLPKIPIISHSHTQATSRATLDPKVSKIDLVIESILPNLPIISHSQTQVTSIAEPSATTSSDQFTPVLPSVILPPSGLPTFTPGVFDPGLFLPSSMPIPRTKVNVAPPPGLMLHPHRPYMPPAGFTPEVFDPDLPSSTLTSSVKATVAIPHGGMWHGPHVTGASFTPEVFDPRSDLPSSTPTPSVQATIAPRNGPLLRDPYSGVTPSAPATTNLLRGGMWHGPHRVSNLSSSSTLPTPPPPPPPPPPQLHPPFPPQIPHPPISPRAPYHRPVPLPPFANMSSYHHPITAPPTPPPIHVNSTYTLIANFPNSDTTCSHPFTAYDLISSPDTCYPLTRYHHDMIGVRWGTGAEAMKCGLRLYKNQNCTGALWKGGCSGLEDWNPEEKMDEGGWGCRSMKAFGGPWGSVRGGMCEDEEKEVMVD